MSRVIGPCVIVALDFAEPVEALALVARLSPDRCRLKVGKELFTSAGPALIASLVERGFDVFLDLKFHDIPNTVARALTASAALGVWMVNVHALGGGAMLAAARSAIDACANKPLLIAVTVLTSMAEQDLIEVGLPGDPAVCVMRLAGLARRCGLDGVVCSPQEAAMVRRELGPDMVLVTPGVRSSSACTDDQRRTLTAAEAVRAGSDYLVIGRPITQAPDPLAALGGIEQEIMSASLT